MQQALKSQLDFQYPGWRYHLKWSGDNSKMVVEIILPLMTWLDSDIRQVIEWAYGYGPDPSYEKISNGSSGVRDLFFDGLAKDPHGVGHDYLHWLSREKMADPNRKIWTFNEASDWYRRASEQFGDGKAWSVWKKIGLDLLAWPTWGPGAKKRTFKKR